MEVPPLNLLALGVLCLVVVSCGSSASSTPTPTPDAAPTLIPAPTPDAVPTLASAPTPDTAPTLVPAPTAGLAAPAQRDYWPTDGWRTSTPQEQGMDAETLSKADTYIREQTPNVRALLIVRHGYIVFEGYYQGHDESDYHDIRSATKSFISALIGIALREKSITSLDQRLVEFFPQYFTSESDSRTREITVRDLLTMTGGFDWDEMGSQEHVRRWSASGDKVKFLIDQPLSDEPGRVFNYNSAGSHMLSAIITKTTGESALEFADKHLFSSLGISIDEEAGFSWPTDAQGYNTGGYGLRLTVRDLAKFGYLYLNNGFWDSEQIVPADYAAASTRQQSEGGAPEQVHYGYQWWVTTEQGHAAYFAAGFGGQFIYVIPDLDLVAVIVSNASRPGINHKDVIGLYVVPAAK